METFYLDRYGTNVLLWMHRGEKSGQGKGALKMKQSERPSNEKGGAPQGEVHSEKLVAEIIMVLEEAKEQQLRLILRFAQRIVN